MDNKGFTFRLYPNEEQQKAFSETFGCCRFVYNHYLQKCIEIYETENRYMTHIDCTNDLTNLKKEKPFLKEADSVALYQSLKHLDNAFQRFFAGDTRYPKLKTKKSKQAYTTLNVKGNVRIEGKHIRLPKVGLVRIKPSREVPDGYKLKSATVTKTPSDKYFVSVLFEYESQVEQTDPKKYIGLDFSVPKLFVSSEPEVATEEEFLQNFRKSMDKLSREKRKLSHCEEGSNRYEKQRVKVARIQEKIANQRNDYLHKISTYIADNYDVACIEDIKIMGVTKQLNELRKGMGKYTFDNGWCNFTEMLEYKLKDRGKYLVKADKDFPSTQTCSVCGNVNNELTLVDRKWTCPCCGAEHDRDINAAINLKNEGKRLLAAKTAG